jgi:redox-sensing transcriptional repressor
MRLPRTSGGAARDPAGTDERARRRIPEATVSRLPVYLRVLYDLAQDHVTNVSSERLAELAGVNAAKVRKDLSYLGSYGTRGVGYDVEYLLYQMNRELGMTREWPIVIVGAGNLGLALANYAGFDERGYPVAALLDIDPDKVGRELNGVKVRHVDELDQVTGQRGSAIGVVATSAAGAQDAADRLASAGIQSILNFAPVVLSVPRGVTVRRVDLAVELQILSFYQLRRSGIPIHALDGSPDDQRLRTFGLMGFGGRLRADQNVRMLVTPSSDWSPGCPSSLSA